MNNVFINNINEYLRQRKIKHNYIALMTEWDKNNIIRLLNGKADLKWNDMEILAKSLGHDIIYFMEDKFKMEDNENRSGQIAFLQKIYRMMTKKQQINLWKCFDFMMRLHQLIYKIISVII